jgi:hypothetical protein
MILPPKKPQTKREKERKKNTKAMPVTGLGGLKIPHIAVSLQPYAPAALYSSVTLLFCFWYSFLLEVE